MTKISRRSRRLMASALFTISFSVLTTSCGKPFEVDEVTEDKLSVAELTMDRHSVDLIAGDIYQVPTTVKPDTLAERGIYWESADTSVVRISEGRLVAVGAGQTTVKAIAMAGLKSDTCHIRVMEPWVVDPYAFLYDMVIYADVSVNGRAANDSTLVGVFGRDESGRSQLKGIGVMRRSADGKPYMQLRTYSNGDDGESLTLRCYDRSRALLLESKEGITFENNSTLGTLSHLYSIVFE